MICKSMKKKMRRNSKGTMPICCHNSHKKNQFLIELSN